MEVVKGVNALTNRIVLNDLLDKDLDDYVEWGIRENLIQPTLLNSKSDPLAEENLEKSLEIVNKIRLSCPQKTIWLYTGYTWGQIMHPAVTDIFDPERDKMLDKRKEIVSMCNILVDGKFIDSQRDITLKWSGSTNQRLINIQQSLAESRIVLHSG